MRHRFTHHPKLLVPIILLALVLAFSLATVALAYSQDNNNVTHYPQVQTGSLKIAKIITGDMPEGGPWTQDDFCITVTGPGGFSWSGCFPPTGPIVIPDLIPGTYTITENETGASWIVTGEGTVTVAPGPGETPVVITNEGVTTTTTESTTTTEETTTTTEETTTSTAPATTATTAPPTTQAVESTTPIPSEVATGGGGTAGLGTGIYALIALAAALAVGLILGGFQLAMRRK